MGRSLALVLTALALAGCATTWKAYWGAADAKADVKCRELGFKPGTDGYGNCRLQLAQIRATNRAAASAAIQSRRAKEAVPGVVAQPAVLSGGRAKRRSNPFRDVLT